MLHSRIDYPKDDEAKAYAAARRADPAKSTLGLAERGDATRGGRTMKPGEAA